MALYPGTENELRVPRELLHDTVVEIFSRCGMAPGDASTVAGSLVEADLRGIHSHGVLRVPDYVGKLRHEGVDPTGQPRISKEFGNLAVVDCGNNLGQIGMMFAARWSIAKAKDAGIALAAVSNSNHAGTMEYFARQALAEGMIGMCGTNALPTMAPWGGKDKLVGINPLGIAIPGGSEGDFVLDIAFGETAHGKIRVFAQKGEPIPETWAYDAEGNATTDAVAALEGLIRPIGGHKGVGMGMAIGMLSSLISGSSYGTETGNMVDGPFPGRDSQFFMAVNVGALQDLDEVRGRSDKFLSQIKRSGRAAGTERLYVPGEIEASLEAQFLDEGIPLNDETINDLIGTARSVGANVELLVELAAAGSSNNSN
ncbi:MAG: Ldh family oxidoreductase [Pseudomonadota bacterium]